MLVLGTIGTGGVYTGTNPSCTPYELVHCLRTSGTEFIITKPEMLETVVVATDECKIPKKNILIFNIPDQPISEGFRSWETLMSQGEAEWL